MSDNNNDNDLMGEEGNIDVVRAIEIEINQLTATPNQQTTFSIKKLDRRSFLKLSGIASSSLVLAAIMPGSGAKAEDFGNLVGSVELLSLIHI